MDNAYERVKTEWAIACRRVRSGELAAIWAGRESALAGIETIDQAVARCHQRSRPERAQAALSALLVLAADDVVARLAVITAVLPGLAALSRGPHHRIGTACAFTDHSTRQPAASSLSGGPWDSRQHYDDEVVAVAFLVVRKLAGQRLEWPAAAVLSRVQRQLRTTVAAFRRRRQQERLAADNGDDIFAVASSPRTGLELMLAEVQDACHQGRVTPREARIVAADRVLGWATAEIAAAEGATVAAVQRARSRALRKLRIAMSDAEPSIGTACVG
ncbi:MAG: hypothetical protein QOH17_4795 [Pseudonocardiales bacterium]|jgi:DNA-directed RNA polymerase specialized sigma24 family protein|nr:hypothetical protein [Pseudonocardiales bacterium]